MVLEHTRTMRMQISNSIKNRTSSRVKMEKLGSSQKEVLWALKLRKGSPPRIILMLSTAVMDGLIIW